MEKPVKDVGSGSEREERKDGRRTVNRRDFLRGVAAAGGAAAGSFVGRLRCLTSPG